MRNRSRNSDSDQVYTDEYERRVHGDVHRGDQAYRDSEDTPVRNRRPQRPAARQTRAPAPRPAQRAPRNTAPARSVRSPRPARTPSPFLRSLIAHLVGVVAGLALVGYSYEHPGFLLPDDERPGASVTATR